MSSFTAFAARAFRTSLAFCVNAAMLLRGMLGLFGERSLLFFPRRFLSLAFAYGYYPFAFCKTNLLFLYSTQFTHLLLDLLYSMVLVNKMRGYSTLKILIFDFPMNNN